MSLTIHSDQSKPDQARLGPFMETPMKAVVYHGVGDIRLEDVPDPKIEAPTDAIVRITASAICGTDLHFVRGTFSGMKPGTILGHEAVGIVEELGEDVRNLQIGDRVVIPSTIACGNCSYCRSGYFAQCDVANPNGKEAGTSFFGGPAATGPFHGLQAEKARIPFANIGLVKLPPEISDDQAILLSDIFPTGYFGAEMAEIEAGDWRSKVTPAAAIGSLLGWVAAGLPVIMAGDHERAGKYVSRLLYIAARRRWREARSLVSEVLQETAEAVV